MVTPVLFLDDASRHQGVLDSFQAEQKVLTLIDTLTHLRRYNKKFALNTAVPIAQYQLADNHTLSSILGGNTHRDHLRFILRLSDRSPFGNGLGSIIIDHIEVCTLRGQIPSAALAWATLFETATVSFDAHPDWSHSWVDTAFSQLDDDGDIREELGRVRNACRSEHVTEHLDWLTRLGQVEGRLPASQLWDELDERFPGLRFLSRVQKDLADLEYSGASYDQAIRTLDQLAKDAADWKSGHPEFSTKVSPEHEQREKLCLFYDETTGMTELFELHARFTGALPGRIHFRIDHKNKTFIVAYVGRKLGV